MQGERRHDVAMPAKDTKRMLVQTDMSFISRNASYLFERANGSKTALDVH